MSEVLSMHHLFRPCLELLDAADTNAKQCAADTRRRYGLSQDQMAELIPRGAKTRGMYPADWAICRLRKTRHVVRPQRLMIDHGVGVRVDKTYVLRSIDANFFDVN